MSPRTPSSGRRSRRPDPNSSSLSPGIQSSIPNDNSISPGSESDLDTSSREVLPIRKLSITANDCVVSQSTYLKNNNFFFIHEKDVNSFSIYRNPLMILYYFSSFVVRASHTIFVSLFSTYLYSVMCVLVLLAAVGVSFHIDGLHQPYLLSAESFVRWYGSWVALGILSSVGLGSGLHTFLLFLGPHIAQVTNAAYSCGHIDFISETWDQIECHPLPESAIAGAIPVNLFMVASKIQWTAFCWGLGTAIGELPPYFVARAAARSGTRNAELVDLDQLLNKRAADMSWAEWAKVQVMLAMRQFGFWGILACASIPNPLFDLAGIICGTVGIPFRTFFGATLFGKAIVKTSIQSIFVSVLFSKGGQSTLLEILSTWVPALHSPVSAFLNDQTAKYLNNGTGVATNIMDNRIGDATNILENSTGAMNAQPAANGGGGTSGILGFVWNCVMAMMLGYFVLSIIESLAIQEIERIVAARKVSPPATLAISKRVKSRSRSRTRSNSATAASSYPAVLAPSSPTSPTMPCADGSVSPPLKRHHLPTAGTANGFTTTLRRTNSRIRTKPSAEGNGTNGTPSLMEPVPVRESDADAEMSSPAELRRPLRKFSKRDA